MTVIGLSFAACGDDGGDGKKGTAPTITTESLPGGTVGTAYSQTLEATGDEPVTWGLESGALPTGLNLLTDGTITGTPTAANTYSFTVKAANAAGSDTKELSITIAPAGGGGTAPKITTASLPGGTVGTAYSQTLAATGDSPINWNVSVGSLPAGLTLQSDTISGTPTAAGTSAFTVRAANAAGSNTKQFSITIASTSGGGGVAPTITTATLPSGRVGTAYSQTLAATGGTPITWSLDSGTLPIGLNLFGSGAITGTPTATGTSDFTVKATNASGNNTKQLSITITFIEMVEIQGGPFTMGSPENEPNRSSNEFQHTVELTGFYMGKYPVTQALYLTVTGTNPSNFTTPVSPETSTANRPVENVTWYDAVEFCNKMSEREGLTPVYTISSRTPATGYPITSATVTPNWSANGYRLPTEAQWEYACRAETTTAYNTGTVISDDTGWYTSNSGSRTHEVGGKPANAWGLYDMHGNVWEWCWDWYDSSYYSSSPAQDPTGAVSGTTRVYRGGSWFNSSNLLRSAYRSYYNPDYRSYQVGFRLVLPAQ
jgi:formylglycine-generating enzyme required for sulfatase activity